MERKKKRKRAGERKREREGEGEKGLHFLSVKRITTHYYTLMNVCSGIAHSNTHTYTHADIHKEYSVKQKRQGTKNRINSACRLFYSSSSSFILCPFF